MSSSRSRKRPDAVVRACLTVAALLPYWRLLSFSVVYVTDDIFTSDIFNGELPGRLLASHLIRAGEWPVWTSALCSGFPLAGSPLDPLGLVSFTVLPPAAALDLYLIVLILVAAHGAYSLARRIGADSAGAFVAGVAFAGSGYIAAQLRHLAIVSTVVWLPVGMVLLLEVLAIARAPLESNRRSIARRGAAMGLFGLVLGNQALSGFPQSTYICALVYASFALFLLVGHRFAHGRLHPLWVPAGLLAATVLGIAVGAVVLLPLNALGAVSDRSGMLGFEWATEVNYIPTHALMFFLPYYFGDISDHTFRGPSIFWEEYAYVGLATILLAFYAAVHKRRQRELDFVKAMTVVAFLLVLGKATPVFRIAYEILPGLDRFRLPTRFLVVVDLGLAVLGGVGLTRLTEDLRSQWAGPPRRPTRFAAGVGLLVTLDLLIHQPRQNAFVPAKSWLSSPASAAAIAASTPFPRTYTPEQFDLHIAAFEQARGWADVRPYFEIRNLLLPNQGAGYWDIGSANCYAGISPRWHVDVWGDHNRPSALIPNLTALDVEGGRLTSDAALPNVLRTFGVTHVLSALPLVGATLPGTTVGSAHLFEVPGAARVRVVADARRVSSDDEALGRLVEADFDPDREVLLHDAPPGVEAKPRVEAPGVAGRATIVRESARELAIAADSDTDGFLVVADTFYPGWKASVDGNTVPLYRANVSIRAIPLPAGHHAVQFVFDPPGFFIGLTVSVVSAALLLTWLVAAAYIWRWSR